MRSRLRVAVVGVGSWARQHARVFHSLPGSELVAVVGRREESTRARAGEFGVRAYTDISRMLDAEKPDLITVSLPNEHHFEPTLALLGTGVPLLVEKPLVFSLEEAHRLLEEAARTKAWVAINFNHRYARPVQLTKAAIDEGRLGELVFASWRFGGEPGTSSHPHANLIETQCHGFDMLEHLCGPIASVMAQMRLTPGTSAYGTLAIALEFASGAIGSMVGTYDSSYAYPLTHYAEVNGSEGRAFIEDTVRRVTISRAGDETAQVWQAGYFNDLDREFHRTFDRHAAAVLESLREGGPPPIPAAAGLRALELAHRSIRSFETGQRVATLAPRAEPDR